MLTIKTIKFKYQKQLGSQRNKMIRLSFGTTINITKKKAIQIDGQTTQWHQSITIPIFFNKPIDIQIFQPHIFGYNPEQLDSILCSAVRISNFKQNSCQAFVYNKQKQKAGQLSIKYEVINQKLTLPQDRTKGFIIISSILVHISQCSYQVGYCQFSTGSDSDSICTPQINFISNQIMTSDQFSLKVIPQDFQAPLNVKIFTNNQYTHQLAINISKIQKKAIKYQRMNLYAKDHTIAGYIFIDISYQEKKQKQIQKKSQSMKKLTTQKSIFILPFINNKGRQTPILKIQRNIQVSNSVDYDKMKSSKSHRLINNQIRSILQQKIVQQKTKKKLYTNNLNPNDDIFVKIFNIGDGSHKEKIKKYKIGKMKKQDHKKQKTQNIFEEHPVGLPRPVDFSRLRFELQP